MGIDLSFSDSLWDDFVANHYEKKAVALRSPMGGPIMDEAEAFDLMIRGSDPARKPKMPNNSTVYIKNTALACDVKDYIPTREDKDFRGYMARLKRQFGIDDNGLHINRLQMVDWRYFEFGKAFVAPLMDRIGLPSASHNQDLFFQNYRQTPFGLHKDNAGNFTHVVAGIKRLLVWPYEVLRKYQRDPSENRAYGTHYFNTTMPEHMRESAQVLEGGPGDVLYFPATYWHVAETTPEPSIAYNVSVYFEEGIPHQTPLPQELLGKVWKHAPNKEYPFKVAEAQAYAQEVPEIVRYTVAELKRVLGQMDRAADINWLKYVSAYAFNYILLPDRSVKLSDQDTLKVRPHAGLVYRVFEDGELAFAANGHAESIPASKGAKQLLDQLQKGGTFRISALLADTHDETAGGKSVWSKDQLRLVLTSLAAFHTFDIVSA